MSTKDSWVEKAVQVLNSRVVEHYKQGFPEANDALNEASVDVIRAMHMEHGAAFLLDVNRGTYKKWDGRTRLTNFCASAVLPVLDEDLRARVEARLAAEYVGTQADMVRVMEIRDRVATLGGQELLWS